MLHFILIIINVLFYRAQQPPLVKTPADANGNNDSGYAASNIEEAAPLAPSSPATPRRQEGNSKVIAITLLT